MIEASLPPAVPPAAREPAAEASGRRLGRLFRYALPHKALIVLSMALMAAQALATNARVLLALPVLVRVLEMDVPLARDVGRGAPHSAARERAEAPGVVRALDGALDGMNRLTARWVPDGLLGPADASLPAGEPARKRARLRDKYATLLSVLLLFVLLIAATTLLAYFEDFVNEALRLRILMAVRRDVCARLLVQPVAFYDTARRGDVVQRVLDDVGGVAAALKMMLGSLPEGVLTLGAGLAFLAALSGRLTLVCVLGLLLFLPLRRFTRRIKSQARQRQALIAQRVEVLLQIVSGIRTVKAYRAEGPKIAEFEEADRRVYRESLRVQRAKSASDAATELVNGVLVMALTVGGGFLLLRDALPIGSAILAVFLMQVGSVHRPAKRLVKDVNALNDALASVDRVFEILRLPGPPPDPAGAPAFDGIRDRVRFEHVGFAYRDGPPVIDDVSFEIERGATVALVGPSGGGKSTLCDLLLRLREPTTGRITVDGVPISAFRRDSFRDRTAIVTQDPFLFHTSIGGNIAIGRARATPAEIEAAARAARIHEHVVALPHGYDSEAGERGARLSGGERQRITIARALLRDPDLLVLDEATASLDAENERGVQEAIDRLREGRTTLVIAHRLSTVRRADRIVVLEGGRVVDQGTHDELTARGGLYARLCAMQDLGGAAADAGGGETPAACEPPLVRRRCRRAMSPTSNGPHPGAPRPRPAIAAWIRVALAVATIAVPAPRDAHGAEPWVADPADEVAKYFRTGPIPRFKLVLTPKEYDNLAANPRTYAHAALLEGGKVVFEDVGVKLKGSAGSFRELDDKPGFSVKVDKFKKDQTFHGLVKFSLNNAAQDDTFSAEFLGCEVFRMAGLPTPLVSHARVTINDRDLGLYVLKEGYDHHFLRRHFADPDGNLYDGGFCTDIDGGLEQDVGKDPNDTLDLLELQFACEQADPARRRKLMLERLDVDEFITFMALERMLCHWDGYCMNRNNYRIYVPKDGRAVFLPHGMDQLLGDTDVSVLDDPSGMVALAVLKDAEWAATYRRRIGELLPLFLSPNRLFKRLDEELARVRPALAGVKDAPNGVSTLKSRFGQRAKDLLEQSKLPAPRPVAIERGSSFRLRNWRPVSKAGDAKLAQVNVAGERVLRVEAGPKGASLGAWNARVLVAPGKYRFDASAQADDVAATEGPNKEKGGVGLSVAGAPDGPRLEGTGGWKTLRVEFEVLETPRIVELSCELRATKGRAVFKVGSLRIVRTE